MLMLSCSKVFFVERVYLSCYSQKQGRSLSNSGNKIQKKIGRENLLAHAHLSCESTQIEYLSQKMAQQM